MEIKLTDTFMIGLIAFIWQGGAEKQNPEKTGSIA